MRPPPKTIVQFWHDLGELPSDVEECVRSWIVWERAASSIGCSTDTLPPPSSVVRWVRGTKEVFERCYHPAMQADYFRLCYVLVEGGFYVDADDVCVGTDMAG